ncbi:hypothetical protein QL093DRAFT_2364631 [Fusarium oxysporum]|nr:hypothetical protein QL093DRAFT_2364631 [Fusarium oxysporum]
MSATHVTAVILLLTYEVLANCDATTYRKLPYFTPHHTVSADTCWEDWEEYKSLRSNTSYVCMHVYFSSEGP